MIVLGVNSVYHESSAAIVVDGAVVAAAEEERFNRVKHAKPARVDNPDLLPASSIAYCLDAAGVHPGDLDLVAYSFDIGIRRDGFELDPLSQPDDWGSAGGEQAFLRALEGVPDAVSAALGVDVRGRFSWVPHHLAHAASAYYPCGDQKAAVLVVDGIGEVATAMLGGGDGLAIRPAGGLGYPNSVGFVWEKVSEFLGFSSYDACKVMGLAAYGRAGRYAAEFAELGCDGATPAVRSDLFEFRLGGFDGLQGRFGPRRRPGQPIEQRHADVAAGLQDWNDRLILSLAEQVYQLHPASTLCYSGGVALNCTTNWMLKEKGPFERIYIPPAPHDAGTAIGAALWAYYDRCQRGGWPDPPALTTAYIGPQFADDDIVAAFMAAGLVPQRSPDPAREAARRIAGGQVVGWFQDRMEMGPRALGNRSLLADPRDPTMRDMLNRKVKHREDFRPFAPSVLTEYAADWFELGRDSPSYRYMLFTCPVRPELADRIPAVIHTDGTSRVQLVDADANPRFHRLISNFHEITGVPMVLNTSFNDSEPIVCSPRDALATFAATRIDAVVIGNYVGSR